MPIAAMRRPKVVWVGKGLRQSMFGPLDLLVIAHYAKVRELEVS